MSTSFPKAKFLSRGYDRHAVDDFFAEARRAYEGGMPAEQFSSEQVRRAVFERRSGGYDMEAVDQAMNRLEAAFVQRDRADHVAVNGEAAWYNQVADRATTLYPRLRRPHGQRFAHPKRGKGYRMEEVDALLDRLVAYFDGQEQVTADELRSVTFPAARGKKAYDEGVVDAFLSRAIEILLAVS